MLPSNCTMRMKVKQYLQTKSIHTHSTLHKEMVAVYSLDTDDFTIAPEILLVLVHEGIMITHQKLYYTCTTPPPKKHTKATTPPLNRITQDYIHSLSKSLINYVAKNTLRLHTQAHKTHWRTCLAPPPKKAQSK